MDTIGSVIQHAGETILGFGCIGVANELASKTASKLTSDSEKVNNISSQSKFLKYSGALSLIGAGAIALGSLMQSASKTSKVALED
jgi:hypothetical protein